MIIGVDGNEANVNEQVGVSVYTSNLLKYFHEVSSPQVQFRIFLRKKPRSHLPLENDNYRYEIVPGTFLWSQVFLPLRLYLKREVEVFFSPAHYTPRFCPIPIVVTIHDFSYFYYPDEFLKQDLYKLKNWTAKALFQSKKIIAVSKNTKKDILKFYPLPEDKIEVVYNGFEQPEKSKSPPDDFLQEYNLARKKYVLYVGTLQPRKNVQVLLKAFHRLSQTVTDMKMVLVGKKGWMYDQIFQEARDLKLDDKVVFTGYLPSEKAAVLYQNAFCFVLPSLYEGFGIPILEAMSHSCPVIASYNSSLPEIGEEACLYFDPQSPENLRDKIRLLIENKRVRTELIKKGKERIKYFSWTKCAQQTLEVIKTAAYI